MKVANRFKPLHRLSEFLNLVVSFEFMCVGERMGLAGMQGVEFGFVIVSIKSLSSKRTPTGAASSKSVANNMPVVCRAILQRHRH